MLTLGLVELVLIALVAALIFAIQRHGFWAVIKVVGGVAFLLGLIFVPFLTVSQVAYESPEGPAEQVWNSVWMGLTPEQQFARQQFFVSSDFARSMSVVMSVGIFTLISCGVLKGVSWYYDREPQPTSAQSGS